MSTGGGGGRGHSTAFRVGVGVILLAVLALRLWSVARWSWELDDWVLMDQSQSLRLPAFLFENYNGNVMPGSFLVIWVVTRVAPLAHSVAVAVTAAGATAATAAWAVGLRELCGERVSALVPLLLVALTPLQLQSTIWWVVALETISVQATLGLGLFFATRLARDDRRSDLLGLLVTFAVGLLMWEKVLLLAIPFAAVLVYLAPASGSGWVRRVVRDVACLAAVGAAYTILYLALVRQPTRGATPESFTWRSPDVVARSFGDLLGNLLAPGLLGGPWGSLPTDAHVHAHQGTAMVVLTGLVVVATLLLAFRFRRQAWIPVLGVALFGTASWGLLVMSTHFDLLAFTKVSYERYAIDIFMVACLALALFLAPEAARADLAAPATAARGRSLEAASTLVVLALLSSLVAANLTAARRIGVSPVKAWVENVTADVDRLGPVSVVDTAAPDNVLFAGFWGDHARLSRILAPLGDRVRFDRPGEPLYVVSRRGHLEPAAVGTGIQARPGPDPQCGHALAPGASLRLPMTGTLYPYQWGLQLFAFAGAPAHVVVQVGDQHLPFAIHRGLNAPQAVFVGPADDVRLSSRADSGTICVTGVVIGSITASPRR